MAIDSSAIRSPCSIVENLLSNKLRQICSIVKCALVGNALSNLTEPLCSYVKILEYTQNLSVGPYIVILAVFRNSENAQLVIVTGNDGNEDSLAVVAILIQQLVDVYAQRVSVAIVLVNLQGSTILKNGSQRTRQSLVATAKHIGLSSIIELRGVSKVVSVQHNSCSSSRKILDVNLQQTSQSLHVSIQL